jgi:hypothetical protein
MTQLSSSIPYDLLGMNMDFLSRKRYRLVETAAGERSAQSSWTRSIELPVVAITVPILVVLVVWLGSAHGLPLALSQGLAMILALGLVTPFIRKVMLSSTPTGIDETRYTAPMNPAEDVSNSFEDQDYEGWSGQMANLTSDELEFLSELVGEYLEENDDLNHREFGFAKALLEKIEEELA